MNDWINVSKFSLIVEKCTIMVCWTPLPYNWVKVNVDGSRRCDLGAITAGGVARNSEKVWLAGFAAKKGVGSVPCAELWAILEGLKLA
ncbi:hypothetical protein ACOSP7_023722 [Xanthoceras sorbifolium]